MVRSRQVCDGVFRVLWGFHGNHWDFAPFLCHGRVLCVNAMITQRGAVITLSSVFLARSLWHSRAFALAVSRSGVRLCFWFFIPVEKPRTKSDPLAFRASSDCPCFFVGRNISMADPTIDVLKDHFRQLRLPTMGQEFEKLARDAAATNQNFFQFLLCLTETELATRAANAIATRIKNAGFPVLKDFDTYDFTALPHLSKPKIMELARCEWIEQKYN